MKVLMDSNSTHSWPFILKLGLLTVLFVLTDIVTSRQFHDTAHQRSATKNGASIRSAGSPPSDWGSFLPKFENSTLTNVVAELGQDVFLQCIVRDLGDRTVSWVHQQDLHILAIGQLTYTQDVRFEVIHISTANSWTLHIKYVKKKDAGVYECQVSTSPKMSLLVTLTVLDVVESSPTTKSSIRTPMSHKDVVVESSPTTKSSIRTPTSHKDVVVESSPTTKSSIRTPTSHKVARAVITGNFYVNSGSVINLTCTILDGIKHPSYVYWYHNDTLINYETPPGISIITDKGDTTISRLKISSAKATNSGNYTCHASNADPTNVTVHILNGETPAAMTGGQIQHSSHLGFLSLWLLAIWVITRIMR